MGETKIIRYDTTLLSRLAKQHGQVILILYVDDCMDGVDMSVLKDNGNVEIRI